MSLRLLEVTVSDDHSERCSEIVSDAPVVHQWAACPEDGTVRRRVLLYAQDVESLSDELVEAFGSEEGFRLLTLPVESTLPKPEDDDEEDDEEDEPQESGEDDEEEKKPQRISREELYEDLSDASRLTPVYLWMVALSTVVAAVGLLRGDLAIVIGAMVIAPLLGPNVALSLAATLGDLSLAGRSLKATGAGVGLAAAVSVLLGLLLEVDPSAAEIAARSRADVADVALALAAGTAGTLAFTSGVSAVVVGVMVAVALLPPLVVAGLLAGSGHFQPALGAAVLVITNVTCINLSAIATFLVQKVRPRTWWEEARAAKATRIAVVIWFGLLGIVVALMLTESVRGM